MKVEDVRMRIVRTSIDLARRRAPRPRAGSRACSRAGRRRTSRGCCCSRPIVLFSVTSGRWITWCRSFMAVSPPARVERVDRVHQQVLAPQHVVDVEALDRAAREPRQVAAGELELAVALARHDQRVLRAELAQLRDQELRLRLRRARARRRRAPRFSLLRSESAERSAARRTFFGSDVLVGARHRPEHRRRRRPTAARGSSPGARGRCPSASTA